MKRKYERSIKILQMISDGMTFKQVAYELKVSVPTVYNTCLGWRKKLGAASNQQLIKKAIEAGILKVEINANKKT